MLRWMLLSALGVLLCASCASSGASSMGGGGGVGGNYGQTGCTKNPDCNSCSGCEALCVCTTGNTTQCKSACGSGGQPSTNPPAGGISISEIAVYQGVEIPIMKQGNAVANRNAPVVQNRPAMVRVFVTPASGFKSRAIMAQLEISGKAQQLKHTVNGASAEGNLQSTFNFEVPAAEITGSAAYSVSLMEASGPSQGNVNGARFPASGTKNLGAQSTNGTFKVLLVPMIVNGIKPDTSAARVTAYHDRLMQLYPIPNVEINVRQAYNYSGTVSANGSGWANILQTLQSLRQQDQNVATTVYYYGVLTPAQSLQQYCGYGCVAGLGSEPGPTDVYQRGSVGLGFFPQGGSAGVTADSPTTMAHELGHALGRLHAPCAPPGAQLQGIDPNYPYQGGAIGSWGWDILNHQLKNPSQYKDMMSYCTPAWISDYNYSAIFSRISYVNAHGYFIASADAARAPGRFRVALIEPDGSLQWGVPVDLDTPVMGRSIEVTTVDENGHATGSIQGFYTPFADLPGGELFVRESALTLPDVHSIAVKSLTPATLAL